MSAPDRTLPPLPGALRPFRFPAVASDRTENGLAVKVARTGDLPLVTVELVLDAGAMRDTVPGVASLTAALLESGSADRTAEEIAVRVDALGISLDVGASWDSVTVGFTGLRARLEEAFALLTELVRAPTFPDEEVDRLKQERLGTLKHRRSDPGSLASEMLNLYTFAAGSAYGRPLAGTRDEITALDRDAVAAFHQARYGPVGATLVAAGDVDVGEIASLARRYLGDWRGGGGDAPPPPAEAGPRRATLVVAHRPGAVQTEIRLGHLGVERTAPDFPALQVMNAILGGTFSSRLNLNLRERLGYTYGATSSWTPRRVPGVFSMGAAVQTEATAHSVSEMLREIRGMREAPPSGAELDDARSYLAGVLPLTVETTSGVAARLASLATYRLPDGYWDGYRAALLAVTADDVHRAARERLRPDRAVVAITADATRVQAELEALGEGPVEVVDPETLLH